ncbi:diguanylate cyclase domain-containing protein [Altererythrobacter fulvus]|uniref:diguanylate cyclase domain-containing protein n=1 Tax=Caenibius fulvus TaxID=2126012 RepID=UPI003017A3A2
MAETQSPSLLSVLSRAHRQLIGFAVMLAGLTVMASGAAVIRDNAERNLTLIARTLSYSVEPAIVFGDREAIGESIASLAGNGAVERIEVLDADGAVLQSWSRSGNGLSAGIERLVGKVIWPTPYVIPVQRGGEKIGEVRVMGSSGDIARFLLQGLLIALCCTGIALVAMRILARKLKHGVIDPLNHVAEVARSVRTERAFHRRVPAPGLAEVDMFVDDFNALLSELEGWYDGLTEENQELARQASHDALTGLGNRALFERHLAAAIQAGASGGSRFALLYLDGNEFKQINDCHGHEAGDRVLQAIAVRLRKCVRQADTVFRLGGDEFAILLGAPIEAEEVDAIVDRIEAAMEEAIELGKGGFVALSISVGFAIYPDHGQTAEDLVRSADAAMYRDKTRRINNAFG